MNQTADAEGRLPRINEARRSTEDQLFEALAVFPAHPKTKAEIQPESNWFIAEPDRGFCQNPHDQADGFYE